LNHLTGAIVAKRKKVPKNRQEMKTIQISWMSSLDESEIQEAMDEACVDAHDEHEQYAGLVTMAMEELAFPFAAQVLGENVQVIGAVAPKSDTFGLDLVVEHKKKRYAIAPGSVEIMEPLPDGHMYLATSSTTT
jgi:hypothetical protein